MQTVRGGITIPLRLAPRKAERDNEGVTVKER